MPALISSRLPELIGEYFAWWVRQMRDLLPDWVVTRDATDALILKADEHAAALSVEMRRGERTTPLGRFSLDAAGVVAARNAAALGGRTIPIRLSLSSVTVLEKQLTFPLAAERALGQALAYEMDRETPFTADEVWWDWRVDHRDRARGQIRLTLFLIAKSAAQEIVALLERGGLKPGAIEAPGTGGAHRQIPLEGGTAAAADWSGPVRPLAIACAVLAVTAIIVPFARQSIALAGVDSRIAELQPKVDAVQALRRRVDQAAGAGAAQAMEQAGTADALKVLARTTQVLPDDTYLTDFSLRKRKLSVSGQSAGAAKLIGLLAADPSFQNPAFSAAVTRVQGTKLDAFSITAEVRP
jgi:general secretion pathway protein L